MSFESNGTKMTDAEELEYLVQAIKDLQREVGDRAVQCFVRALTESGRWDQGDIDRLLRGAYDNTVEVGVKFVMLHI